MDEPVYGMSLQGDVIIMVPNFLDEAAGCGGAVYTTDVGLSPAVPCGCEYQSSIAGSSHCPEGAPPPLSLHEGMSLWPPGLGAPPPLLSCDSGAPPTLLSCDSGAPPTLLSSDSGTPPPLLSHDLGEESLSLITCDTGCKAPPPHMVPHASGRTSPPPLVAANLKVPPWPRGQRLHGPRPGRRSRVCRDWRRDDVDMPPMHPLGDGGGIHPCEEGDLVATVVHAEACVLVKGWNGGSSGNQQDATEVRGDSDGRSCDKVKECGCMCDVCACVMWVHV